jgi:hypothetical protein
MLKFGRPPEGWGAVAAALLVVFTGMLGARLSLAISTIALVIIGIRWLSKRRTEEASNDA